MSKDALDITGNKYGNLTAVRYSHTGKNYMQYWVLCKSCGEKALGRKFTPWDFKDIEMNYENGHLKGVKTR